MAAEAGLGAIREAVDVAMPFVDVAMPFEDEDSLLEVEGILERTKEITGTETLMPV